MLKEACVVDNAGRLYVGIAVSVSVVGIQMAFVDSIRLLVCAFVCVHVYASI